MKKSIAETARMHRRIVETAAAEFRRNGNPGHHRELLFSRWRRKHRRKPLSDCDDVR
jgi:hypothetical protein